MGRRQMLFGSGESIAGAIYGTIVVMATIVGAGSAADPDAWRVAIAVVVSTSVLALAHLYSEGIAGSIHLRRRLTAEERAAIWRRELAIPLAAVAPVTALLLGAFEVIEEDTAIWTAILIGLATLAIQGLRYARIERLSPMGTVVSVTINFGLGLLMVGLKAAISH
jgi:hypothetical protein